MTQTLMYMKRILIADDHVVARSGVKALILSLMSDTEIHEARNGREVIHLLSNYTFDLLVLDIHMPDTEPFLLMEYINTSHSDTRVLIFSMSQENTYAKRLLQQGARGYIRKDAALDEIQKAIELVILGRVYISEGLANILAINSVTNEPSNPFQRLSKREFEITSMLLSGQCLSNISKSLNLASSTVGTHKARVFDKLHVENILELKELATIYEM